MKLRDFKLYRWLKGGRWALLDDYWYEVPAGGFVNENGRGFDWTFLGIQKREDYITCRQGGIVSGVPSDAKDVYYKSLNQTCVYPWRTMDEFYDLVNKENRMERDKKRHPQHDLLLIAATDKDAKFRCVTPNHELAYDTGTIALVIRYPQYDWEYVKPEAPPLSFNGKTTIPEDAMFRHPDTGAPRDARDVLSDPYGGLIVRTGEKLKPAKAYQPRTSIDYTDEEIQSGFTRLRWGENLILQLPENHDGRNSWLITYGKSDKAQLLRAMKPEVFIYDHKTSSFKSIG